MTPQKKAKALIPPMTITYTIKTALDGLTANKSRTLLTLLGIVIGITAIILVMSVGEGAEVAILSQFKGFGSNSISIEPGRMPDGPSDFAEMYTESLKERDLEALKKIPGLVKLDPWVIAPVTMAVFGETFRGSVFGVSPKIRSMLDLEPSMGNFFSDDDVKSRASVVVLGSEVKAELFGDSDAIGQKVKIKNKKFRVVGVMAPKGQVMMLNIDEVALMPYTTAQTYLLGIDYFHAILAEADGNANLDRVVEDIEMTLRELHGITDPDKDDFHVSTQAMIEERVGIVTSILTILLGSVAAISLVVGGIGIMNIMLVSVAERTREIGLRKALGATNNNILYQFLWESMIMTVIGGIIGTAIGAGLSYITSIIINKMVFLDWPFSFPLWAALLGLGVATGIGLVFGLYPARQAAKKSPIEALRYE